MGHKSPQVSGGQGRWVDEGPLGNMMRGFGANFNSVGFTLKELRSSLQESRSSSEKKEIKVFCFAGIFKVSNVKEFLINHA